MLNGMATTVLLKVGLIKRHSITEWIFSRTEIFRKDKGWNRFV